MNGDWDLTPDTSRKQRLGFDETIFCASKTPDQIDRVLQAAMQAEEPLLLTRLDRDKFSELSSESSERLDYDEVSHTAILGRVSMPDDAARVAIVSGGSSDVRVAREAARTLAYYRVGVHEIYDVGVAGLWRLLERIEELRDMSVVITVAGMEGTLPSVVAGLVPGLVIAVPVATGYGVAANGITALNSALASCAPGLVVVNVDNGYGAGCAALRMLNVMQRGALHPGRDRRPA
jgi:NCAIR mutase (PurE)-related protein